MKNGTSFKQSGVTLLELILVIVISSAVFVAISQYLSIQSREIRVERTVAQIQQILDAATAYYVVNGKWPDEKCQQPAMKTGETDLIPDYLPNMISPYGTDYNSYYCDDDAVGDGTDPITNANIPLTSYQVNVSLGSSNKADARLITSKLPMTSDYQVDSGNVIAYTMPPPMTTNSDQLKTFQYAGLYHQGACVPQPQCPETTVDGVTKNSAQIFLVPVAVSGVNDDGSTNVYPISSFTAYASGEASDSPANCIGSSITPSCGDASVTGTTTGLYWRACIQIVTERGDVQVTRTDNWGNNVTMAAFTRCQPQDEKSGSGLDLWSN